jgi:hypothetical protein
MIDRITVGAATLMGALAAATGFVRWAVAPPVARGRHRVQPRVVSLDELLGEPSAYTSYRTLTDVPSVGVMRQGFGWCEPCAQTTAGVVTRDGFTCGQCFTPAGGVS